MRSIGSVLSDISLQHVAIKLLPKFDLKFLAAYQESLIQMTTREGLKRVMVHFHVAREGGSIAAGDRRRMTPIICHLLFPHIKKTTQRRKKRGDPVLSYLAGMDAEELTPLLCLCFIPWSDLMKSSFELSAIGRCESGLLELPWWHDYIQNDSVEFWLDSISFDNGVSVSRCCSLLKQSSCFLYVVMLEEFFYPAVDCLLFNLGHKLAPFVSFLAAWMISILSFALDEAMKGAKDFHETILQAVGLLAAFFQQFAEVPATALTIGAVAPLLRRLVIRLESMKSAEE